MFSENLVPRRTASVIAAIDRIREKKAVPFGVGVWVVDGYGYPLVGRCSHGRCLSALSVTFVLVTVQGQCSKKGTEASSKHWRWYDWTRKMDRGLCCVLVL